MKYNLRRYDLLKRWEINGLNGSELLVVTQCLAEIGNAEAQSTGSKKSVRKTMQRDFSPTC